MSDIHDIRRAMVGLVVEIGDVQVSPTRGWLTVNLVVMSHETAREIMRSAGYAGIEYAKAKNEPDRIYGVRIAYDDSLPLWEVLPAHTGPNVFSN